MFRIRRASPKALIVSPTLAALTPNDFAYSGRTGLVIPCPSMMIPVATQSIRSEG